MEYIVSHLKNALVCPFRATADVLTVAHVRLGCRATLRDFGVWVRWIWFRFLALLMPETYAMCRCVRVTVFVIYLVVVLRTTSWFSVDSEFSMNLKTWILSAIFILYPPAEYASVSSIVRVTDINMAFLPCVRPIYIAEVQLIWADYVAEIAQWV
jgi:hypothetical protein